MDMINNRMYVWAETLTQAISKVERNIGTTGLTGKWTGLTRVGSYDIEGFANENNQKEVIGVTDRRYVIWA